MPRVHCILPEKNLSKSEMNNTYQEFTSMQNSVHRDLIDLVNKYASTQFCRPIAHHQRRAFCSLLEFARNFDKLIVDSGCGTGMSTTKLAEQFPHHGVIGIDKSVARLSRAGALPSNALLVRGDLIDLWRLIREENLPVTHHFVLYPNPWPKIGHVKRRFHAHPIFRTMVEIAPYFELRTNWRLYADECVVALKTLGYGAMLNEKIDGEPITLFEKKYMESRCSLFVVTKKDQRSSAGV